MIMIVITISKSEQEAVLVLLSGPCPRRTFPRTSAGWRYFEEEAAASDLLLISA